MSSNVLLYHLQRHSDHHANPTRRFQALRHFDEAPELPSGLRDDDPAGADPAAVVPGHGPRVVAHYEGDVTRANIDAPASATAARALRSRRG